MQQELWTGVGVAMLVAVIAGLGERKRKRRRDMDRIGLMNWPLIQVLALLTALILTSLALHLG
ncbi:MAG: hypothetical protein KF730_02555 [Sphingomonas sp.]|uniref:hypothetical protein n=1 Tax=Sphingomonas sp. TaxID=28214 RepID=UPI0025FE4525|nr:hypothetical protein [Sphingomonas sp.]MBX3563437.1 hypothetical protein [Sphingomonas sp.]